MQVAAVLAIGVFDSVGVLGTSVLRFAIAAAFLLVLFRPRLTGRTREEWTGIVWFAGQHQPRLD